MITFSPNGKVLAADGMSEAIQQLSIKRDAWLHANPPPWSEELEMDFHKRFSQKIDEWMDLGHGECLLRRSELREPLADDPQQQTTHPPESLPNSDLPFIHKLHSHTRHHAPPSQMGAADRERKPTHRLIFSQFVE